MAHNPETTVRKIFTLPKDLWQNVEDYRYAERIPTEAEAMRRLIEQGLSQPGMLQALIAALEFLGTVPDDQLNDAQREKARGLTLAVAAAIRGWANALSEEEYGEDDGASGMERTIDYAKDPHISPDAYVRSVGKPTRQKFPKPPKKL